MALLRYLKPTKAPTASTLALPSGLLLEAMPSSSIEAANKEVKPIIIESSENDAASTMTLTAAMKRGTCVKFSQRAKVSVAKYASEHHVAAARQTHNSNHMIELECQVEWSFV